MNVWDHLARLTEHDRHEAKVICIKVLYGGWPKDTWENYIWHSFCDLLKERPEYIHGLTEQQKC